MSTQATTEESKCRESAYYYATRYLIVNGKPFTTKLSKEEFNRKMKECLGDTDVEVEKPPIPLKYRRNYK